MKRSGRRLLAGSDVFPMKTRVSFVANCTTVSHDKSNHEAGLK